MNSLKVMCLLMLIIFPLFAVGCGDKDDTNPLTENETEQPIDTENNVPQTDIPQPFNGAINSIKNGMEGENVNSYLTAFWEDDYYYQSDLGTDDPGDDVTFDNIELERDCIQRLFSNYDAFTVEFTQAEIMKEEEERAEVKCHHQLLASVGQGKALPGGYQKILAEGISVFSFKKVGVKWRINKWTQEEMTKQEIIKAYDDLNQKPPEGAFIEAWGLLKAR